MASLNTLRTRGGVIVTAVIFIALVAFLLGDLLGAGGTLFSARKMRVGSVAGNNIGYVEFLNESNRLTDVYKVMWRKDALSSEEQDAVYNVTWDQMIRRYSYEPSFESMGLTVSDAEQVDMVGGNYISPVILQTFVNPQTGMFDREFLKEFLSNVDYDQNAYRMWDYLKDQMLQHREMTKLSALVRNGFGVNELEVSEGVRDANNIYAARVAWQTYASVPDSLINITGTQVRDYYAAHKKAFRQSASRDIEYVVFDLVPSEEDYAAAKEYIDQIAAEFNESEMPMQYATINSQVRPDIRYYPENQLEPQLAAIAFGKRKGETYGPVLSGDKYTVSRLSDIKMMPDSLGARHILVGRDRKPLADSLLGVLKSGGDFAALAEEYSADPGSARNGGDLGRFAPEQMITEFSEACVAANQGDIFTVESPYGIHVVELLYKSRPVEKAQIATITYAVEPSEPTQQEVYGRASSFLSAAGSTLEGFRQAVNDEVLAKRNVRIRNTDRTISGMDNSRELVRWAFNNDEGAVSGIMEVDGSYVVAALTEVREDGTATLKQASPEIRAVLMREARGRLLAEKVLGATTVEEAAEAFDTDVHDVQDVQFASFYIPDVGVEPKLIGAICGGVPEGVLSAPVEGASGLYVFEITDVSEKDNVTEESERVRLEANLQNYLPQRLQQALVEESEVTDRRVRFF